MACKAQASGQISSTQYSNCTVAASVPRSCQKAAQNLRSLLLPPNRQPLQQSLKLQIRRLPVALGGG
jgi:hypothetical protein